MFWIFFLLVSIASFIYSARRDIDYIAVPSLIGIILSCVLLALLLSEGIMTYPGLVGQLHKVEALQQRIDDIKAAVYPEQSGKLVGGSLTNFQQSSRLSDYLHRVAEAEAKYSSSLAKAQFYKRDGMWNVFGHGFFISDKVLELPEIEG